MTRQFTQTGSGAATPEAPIIRGAEFELKQKHCPYCDEQAPHLYDIRGRMICAECADVCGFRVDEKRVHDDAWSNCHGHDALEFREGR